MGGWHSFFLRSVSEPSLTVSLPPGCLLHCPLQSPLCGPEGTGKLVASVGLPCSGSCVACPYRRQATPATHPLRTTGSPATPLFSPSRLQVTSRCPQFGAGSVMGLPSRDLWPSSHSPMSGFGALHPRTRFPNTRDRCAAHQTAGRSAPESSPFYRIIFSPPAALFSLGHSSGQYLPHANPMTDTRLEPTKTDQNSCPGLAFLPERSAGSKLINGECAWWW